LPGWVRLEFYTRARPPPLWHKSPGLRRMNFCLIAAVIVTVLVSFGSFPPTVAFRRNSGCLSSVALTTATWSVPNRLCPPILSGGHPLSHRTGSVPRRFLQRFLTLVVQIWSFFLKFRGLGFPSDPLYCPPFSTKLHQLLIVATPSLAIRTCCRICSVFLPDVPQPISPPFFFFFLASPSETHHTCRLPFLVCVPSGHYRSFFLPSEEQISCFCMLFWFSPAPHERFLVRLNALVVFQTSPSC